MKILLLANTDWFLYRFRLSLARRLREMGWETVLASPHGPFVSRMESDNFKWIPVRMNRRGILPHREFLSLFHISSIYRNESPDIVHHFTMKPVLYGSIAARMAQIPHVVNSVAGLGYLFLTRDLKGMALRNLIRPIFRYALSGTNLRVVFENDGDRDHFVQSGLVQQWKTVVIHGVGIDLEMFSPVPEPPEPPLVILAGRLLKDKGVGEFVEASRVLRDRHVDARFVLVGAPDPGNPATISDDKLQEWVQEGVIEWWGQQDDMSEVFAKSHIVTLPSYGEGLPTVLMEAAACSRPIIATDIPGCREVVHHGETGFLVPVGDAEALAEALEKLLIDSDMRIKLGKNGRQLMEQRFSQRRINDQTAQVYQDLVSSTA